MFSYTLLACFVLVFNQVSSSSWEDCGGNDSVLKIHSLDLDNPIRIGKKDPIRISMNATQTGEISGDSSVNIVIKKNLKILGQTLPINVPCFNGIGSCQMKLCELFSIHRKLACAIFEAANRECSCPSAPGEYIAKDLEYQLNFGLIPQALLAIGNGDYSFDMEITNDNKQLGCVKIAVAVKFV